MILLAKKSYKTLVWYTVRLLFYSSLLAVGIYMFSLKNYSIITVISFPMFLGATVYCLVKWICLLPVPSKLMWSTEDGLIIYRRFRIIKITYDSILSIDYDINYIRLLYGKDIELGSGTLYIETSKHLFKIIGVSHVDLVKTRIMLYQQESRQSLNQS